MNAKQKIFSKLESLDAIISPPTIIAEILSLNDQESSSAAGLSRIILKDADLTARVLRIANSPFYGCRQEVTSVNQAIMIIGRNAVKCLLLSIGLYNKVASEQMDQSKDFEKLWQHLLETAVAAKNAAGSINYSVVDEAYIAGLLHDFGRSFLLRYFPGECDEIYRLSMKDKFLIDAEREVLDSDHQEIGRYIAERWNLPESLAEVIGNHHPVDEAEISKMPALSKIVVFADCLSPANYEYPENLDGAGRRITMLDASGKNIGISVDDIKTIYGNLPQEVLINAEGFDLNLGDVVEYLSRANKRLFDLYLDLAGAFRESRELPGKLLEEERLGGIQDSLNIALATLSHYINNATMNISGQCEVLQLLYQGGDKEKVYNKIPPTVEQIKASVRKISLILEELSRLSGLENVNHLGNPKAIDIEAELKSRLEAPNIPA
jgi:putative nucleotidyltransferase with HDIG domain